LYTLNKYDLAKFPGGPPLNNQSEILIIPLQPLQTSTVNKIYLICFLHRLKVPHNSAKGVIQSLKIGEGDEGVRWMENGGKAGYAGDKKGQQ
jgi:hypothetical protein